MYFTKTVSVVGGAKPQTKLDFDSCEPPENAHRADMNEQLSSSPKMNAMLQLLQEHAAEVGRLNIKMGSLNVLLTYKDQPQTENTLQQRCKKRKYSLKLILYPWKGDTRYEDVLDFVPALLNSTHR